MKHIVRVNGLEGGESREYEFDDEEKALHERSWYLTYTTAESVELVTIRETEADMTGRRKRWGELNESQRTEARWLADLEDGETYEEWWETWMDAIEEDKSYQTEGWPFGR